jgi:hypothetical protein
MQDLLSRLKSDDLAVIVFLTLAFLAGMIVWLSLQWRLHRRTEIEAALKHDMLNRGMCAEDIERVLRASLSGSCARVDDRDAGVPGAGFHSGQRCRNRE